MVLQVPGQVRKLVIKQMDLTVAAAKKAAARQAAAVRKLQMATP